MQNILPRVVIARVLSCNSSTFSSSSSWGMTVIRIWGHAWKISRISSCASMISDDRPSSSDDSLLAVIMISLKYLESNYYSRSRTWQEYFWSLSDVAMHNSVDNLYIWGLEFYGLNISRTRCEPWSFYWGLKVSSTPLLRVNVLILRSIVEVYQQYKAIHFEKYRFLIIMEFD